MPVQVASEKKPSGKENVSEDANLGKKQSKRSTSRPILSRPVSIHTSISCHINDICSAILLVLFCWVGFSFLNSFC